MPYLESNNKRIHYADWPPANGGAPRSTFLLIHGLGSSQNYYGGVVAALTAQNHRCVALDTTGQGRSPYTGVEQSIASLARDMLGALDALGIAKVVVVGHSMSGLTVPYLATIAPERITAMVLLGPVYPNKGLQPLFEQRIIAVEKAGMQAMGDTIPFAAVGSAARPLHSAFIRELLMASQPAGYISLCRILMSSVDNKPAYGKVVCPALLIAGDEDKAAPVSGCQQLLEELGTPAGEKKIEVMKKTGHWMAIEAPEDVAEMVLSFVKTIQ